MKKRFISIVIMVAVLLSMFSVVAFATDQGTVLYNKGGITITYQNYSIDEYGDFKINMLIENNSSKYICVQTRDESINGFMISGSMSSDVQIGKKAYADLSFSDFRLEENYISSIYNVEFTFHIFEEDGWDTIDDSNLVQLTFGGVNLNNGVSADTRPYTTFYNNGGLKVSYYNYDYDEYNDLNLHLLIENNSSKYVCVQARDESINGFMISGSMSSSVKTGNKAYTELSFSDFRLKENKITTVNEIEFSLHIFEEDGWDTIEDTKLYKITPSGVVGYTASNSTPTPAPTPAPAPAPAQSNITVEIDGKQIAFDVQPQIINGRTLVPLRAIFENLGATVDWNNDTQTVTSVKGNTKISLTINNNTMYVNGTAKTLDVPATLIGGRTLVPVRAISEAFGCNVGWDGDNQKVSITTISNTPIVEAPVKTVTYQDFVDFVKAEGSLNDDGLYGIQTDIPYHSSESGTSYGTITLVYNPKIDELELQVLESYESRKQNSVTMQFLVVYIPKKAEKYNWQFQYMIDDESYKNNDYFMASEGTIKADAESYLSGDAVKMSKIITGKEITEGSSEFNVGSLVVFIDGYGDNIFKENGSNLSFDYFGLK